MHVALSRKVFAAAVGSAGVLSCQLLCGRGFARAESSDVSPPDGTQMTEEEYFKMPPKIRVVSCPHCRKEVQEGPCPGEFYKLHACMYAVPKEEQPERCFSRMQRFADCLSAHPKWESPFADVVRDFIALKEDIDAEAAAQLAQVEAEEQPVEADPEEQPSSEEPVAEPDTHHTATMHAYPVTAPSAVITEEGEEKESSAETEESESESEPESSEEKECPLCAYEKEGPCGDGFEALTLCFDEKDPQHDDCVVLMKTWMKCMKANPEWESPFYRMIQDTMKAKEKEFDERKAAQTAELEETPMHAQQQQPEPEAETETESVQ